MTHMHNCDVVVVGAGIIGASCAYQLSRSGLRVVVVESCDGPAQGSSGRSFASVRGQWADPLNIEIAWRSICAYRDFATTHGADVFYRPTGYLFLIPEAQWETQLAAVELQRSFGVPVDVLTVGQAQNVTPFIGSGIAGATWGRADGQVDPHLATTAFLSMARELGAAVLYRHPVTTINSEPKDNGWTVTAGPETIRTQYLVNAAGGWAGEIASLAGLSVPVVHSRRNVYSSAAGAVPSALPMTVDVGTGVFLRSEGDRVLFGGARPDEVDGYNVSVDRPWMEGLLEIAVDRFPWLAEMPLDRAGCWAGTYENTPDHRAILGADPAAPTWINACGLSGHGVMQAPEIGRLVAEQVTAGSITSIDATALQLSRFDGAGSRPRPAELVF